MSGFKRGEGDGTCCRAAARGMSFWRYISRQRSVMMVVMTPGIALFLSSAALCARGTSFIFFCGQPIIRHVWLNKQPQGDQGPSIG